MRPSFTLLLVLAFLGVEIAQSECVDKKSSKRCQTMLERGSCINKRTQLNCQKTCGICRNIDPTTTLGYPTTIGAYPTTTVVYPTTGGEYPMTPNENKSTTMHTYGPTVTTNGPTKNPPTTTMISYPPTISHETTTKEVDPTTTQRNSTTINTTPLISTDRRCEDSITPELCKIFHESGIPIINMESLNEFFGKHSLMCTTVMTTTAKSDCVDLSGAWSTYTIYGFGGIVTLSQTGCKGTVDGLQNGPYIYSVNGLEISIDWQQAYAVKGSINEMVSEIILDNGITYKKN